MVPIDKQIVATRIEHIRTNLRHLKQYGKIKGSDFKSDPKTVAAAERMLQTAIEAMIDIGNHIIANEGFEAPEDYKDVFLILGKNGILPKNMVTKFVEMTKFRNLIVHTYLEIDVSRLHQILKKNLEDFDKFIKIILKKFY